MYTEFLHGTCVNSFSSSCRQRFAHAAAGSSRCRRSDPRSDGAEARSGCRGAGAAASGGSATPLQGPARPASGSLHGHGRGSPGARAGRPLEPSRGPAGGGAARGVQADKERGRLPNKEAGAEDFRIGAGEVAERRSERGRGKGGVWSCELVFIFL